MIALIRAEYRIRLQSELMLRERSIVASICSGFATTHLFAKNACCYSTNRATTVGLERPTNEVIHTPGRRGMESALHEEVSIETRTRRGQQS